ncbi:type II toxin-antitoxin system mRNA interferase toxin, RelE/StbE family [Helicobacter pylori]|nr:type II toxin-antitoxin system mRNA interferase toxin, RelE/StbE family [Helicobacter pylori]WQS00019.1 type II toxin-antitoxin system mRNA interferase toxin, RelE/StbE family [Helicobacter pylori]WQS02832.1 type II toxin-antitoxin system mRNA interferase toxin, RelE/StbE family [Helicobacter pylori]
MQRPPTQRRFIKDFRECHLKPDLLLVYQIKKQENTLFLVRLGSHSELFYKSPITPKKNAIIAC